VLEQVVDFLPAELDPESVRVATLIARTFDRAHGQLLLILRRDGHRAVLSRPSDFELFREIPCERDAFAVVRSDVELRLEVRVVDGRLLKLALLPEEAHRVEELLRAATMAPPPRIVGERASIEHGRDRATAPSSRPPARETLREPRSAEAEVVHVREGLLRPVGATGPAGPPATRPSPRPPPPSEPPPALRPSPDALAGAAGQASERSRESVRPPAFADEPAPARPTGRDVAALRALLRQHWERGALDEASQVARALVFLGEGEAIERRLAGLQPETPPSLASPIGPHLFKAYVAHDDEDPDLARLCVALWPALLSMRLRAERDLGLRPRDEVDFASPPPGFARCFQSAARDLGIPRPRLWIREDIPGGLAYLNVSPVGSLCGKTLATGFSLDEMLFAAAHHLALYRPEVYLVALLPSLSDLVTLACAGLLLERRVPADPKLARVAEPLERFMVPQVRDSLRTACAELTLIGDPRTAISEALARFRRAALLSSARAGLVLSGSLKVASRMLRLMPAQPGLTTDDLVDDLVGFSVSPAYAALRREVGVALAPSEPEGAGE
jgi:hypothetical protein